jgi:hypothetical protein
LNPCLRQTSLEPVVFGCYRAVNKKGDAMTRIIKTCTHLTLVLVLFTFLAMVGCEGTDTREKVNDTVEELAGKKDLDRMDRMKKTINKAQEQQQERYKKTEESAEQK